jgi:hypothetical protein
MKNKKILAVYLNEFNFNYLKYGAKKYRLKYLKKLFLLKKISTFTKDKIQNKNLDPWVQSVSINTGKISNKHKIFKLGQKLDDNLFFIWDILTKKKVDCYVWGSINSRFTNRKYLKLFFPDPWNYSSDTYPNDLKPFHILPRYYAKNYLELEFFKIIKYSIIFFIAFIKNNGLNFFIKNFFLIFNSFFYKGLKNYILFFLFDLISLNLFKKRIKTNNNCFSYIFLNSLAHFQHNNWSDTSAEKYYFLFVDKIMKSIFELYQSHNSLIIFNGFSQKKINDKFLIRPKNPIIFLSNIIKFKNLEQDMTNGGFIFFKDKKEADIGFKKLTNYTVCGIKIFEILQKKNKSFFYKIKINSTKDLRKININRINKKILLKSFQNDDKKKMKINFNFEEISKFLDSIRFIKTTGIHSTKGNIFYDNIKILKNKKLIENQQIFNIFTDYFKN